MFVVCFTDIPEDALADDEDVSEKREPDKRFSSEYTTNLGYSIALEKYAEVVGGGRQVRGGRVPHRKIN